MADGNKKSGAEMAKEMMKDPKLLLGYREPLPEEVMDCLWHYPLKFSFAMGDESLSESTRGMLKHRIVEKIEYGYLEDPMMLHEEALKDPDILHTAVEEQPSIIGRLEDPDKDLQLMAVRSDGRAIRFIKDPDIDVKLEAVRQNPEAVLDIHKEGAPLDKEIIEEMKKDPLDYEFVMESEEFRGEKDVLEMLEGCMTDAYEQMEAEGLAYADDDICVVRVDGKADIKEGPDGMVQIKFHDPRMQKNLEKMTPEKEEETPFARRSGKGKEKAKTYFVEKQPDGFVNLYGGSGKLKDGSYHAAVIEKDLLIGEALDRIEKGLPDVKTLDGAKRAGEMRTSVARGIADGVKEKEETLI